MARQELPGSRMTMNSQSININARRVPEVAIVRLLSWSWPLIGRRVAQAITHTSGHAPAGHLKRVPQAKTTARDKYYIQREKTRQDKD